MTNPSNDIWNYIKLDRLLIRSYDILRQLFKRRYSQFHDGKVWDDTPECGRTYFNDINHKGNSKISLTEVQRTFILNGDSSKWDLTTLAVLLINTDGWKKLNKKQEQQLHQENKRVKQLKCIRNQLVHHATKSIPDGEFNKIWNCLRSILLAFDDTDTELDKIKNGSIFHSSTQPKNEKNVKEASRLNSLGTQAHKDGQFSEAISFFTQATALSDVPDSDRAIFFSNMSSTRLAMYEQGSNPSNICEVDDLSDQRYYAWHDAEQTRKLWPIWWKGYLRLGKVYATLNEYEKAIKSFERAADLSPENKEIQIALDKSRQMHNQQLRAKCLDAKLTTITTPEELSEWQQKLDMDVQKAPIGDDSIEEIGLSQANVIKGHKYAQGDEAVKQNYERAAEYFAKAARQDNAEGMFHLAQLTDKGLGVKKDHIKSLELYEQAAKKPPRRCIFKIVPNIGVAEAEHSLGLRYADGIGVHKNLSTAAYWYERAMNHGSAESANHLALLYLEGSGVDKNVEKAEQLLHLSARRGSSNAMLKLAELLLYNYNFEMAEMCYNQACEAGNFVAKKKRDIFEKMIVEQKQFIRHCSSCVLQMIIEITSVVNTYPYLKNYDMLNEHSNRGSKTAQKLCNALEQFVHAFNLLMQSETLTEKQENTFVHHLSQCYRTEHIVAQLPSVKIRRKIDAIVDRVCYRCGIESNTITSQLDEDARICYATLQMNSHDLAIQFLDTCKQKYPKTIYFYELSGLINNLLELYELSLRDANAGLEIDPNNCELLYFKAVALYSIHKNMGEARKAFRTFLRIAPEDHRRIPELYYAQASYYFKRHILPNFVKKIYKKGEKTENMQLPCFLPYDSSNKKLLKHLIDPEYVSNTGSISINRKSYLTDPHRIEVITQHRDWESQIFQIKNNPNFVFTQNTSKYRVQQQPTDSSMGLKSITLRDMNPIKDHVYNGCMLSVTIIEEASSWIPSIHLVVEDEHFDCERVFIYDFPEGAEEYLISKVFTMGSKIQIINPCLRLGKNDTKSLIRIDDFSSIIMQHESKRVINMCRCCGEADAQHICNKCKQARYCSKECQTMDLEIYRHKLICENISMQNNDH